MADISQIEVNGTTYDICDATARDSLSSLPTKIVTYTGAQNAMVGTYGGNTQLWGLSATCINSNNSFANGKRYALIVANNNLGVFSVAEDKFIGYTPFARAGSGSVSVKVNSVGTTSKKITFPAAFPSVPSVNITKVANFGDNSGGVNLSQALQLSISGVSTTEFTVYCTCNSNTASNSVANVSFHWIAMV